MANIPTIPGTAVTQDVAIGQKLDPSTGLALQSQVAKTFETAANVIGEYEDKKQVAEESFVANTTAASFQKFTQDFRQRTIKMSDDQIVPQWEQESQAWLQAQKDQYGQKLTRQTQAQLYNAWDRGVISARGEFQTVADAKSRMRYVGAVDALGNAFVQNANPATAAIYKDALDKAVEAGYYDKDRAKEKIAEIPQKIDVQRAMLGINTNPFQTYQELKNGEYKEIKNENIKRQLMNDAFRGYNDDQRTNNENFYSQITQERDINKWPSDKDIDTQVTSGRLSARQGESLKNLKAGKIYDHASARAEQLKSVVDSIDFTDPVKASETINMLSGESNKLPPDLKISINKYLAKSEKTYQQPIKADIRTYAAKMYAKGNFRPLEMQDVPGDVVEISKFFGLIKTKKQTTKKELGQPTEDAYWQQTASPETQAQALSNRTKFMQKMDLFMEKNPIATPDQVQGEMERLMGSHIISQVSASLTKPKFTVGQKARQNGITYQYDGNNWNPVK